MFRCVCILLFCSSIVAELTPTAPGPGDIFKIGGDCLINWTVATAGAWSNTTITLMAGSNNAMQVVATVVSGLDGNDPSLIPYTWTCPDVVPHSPVYFYQFADGSDRLNLQWTTRFTIVSSSGQTTQPENALQPNGDAVPWGSAKLNSKTKTQMTTTRNYTPSATAAHDDENLNPIMPSSISTRPNKPNKIKTTLTPMETVSATVAKQSPQYRTSEIPNLRRPGVQTANGVSKFASAKSLAFLVCGVFVGVLSV